MKVFLPLLPCVLLLLSQCTSPDTPSIADTTAGTVSATGFDTQADQSGLTDGPVFELLASSATGIDFTNPIIESDQLNILAYEYLYNGGGVAVGDINNDGRPDLYFSGNMVPNKLYLNMGDFKFSDITATAGVDGGQGFKSGVTMVDINGDGWLDIYVCKTALSDPQYRHNVLYVNNQDGTFTDQAATYGINDASFSTQAYFFDMDNDGDLDLYLVNHPGDISEGNNINIVAAAGGGYELVPVTDNGYESDRLYRNDGKRFTDITTKAGILNHSFGLSAVIADFNEDGYMDVYVCNDYVMPDNLYINQRNGTFRDSFESYFHHSTFSSMGSDYADINNDGCPDLITVDMLAEDNHRQKMLGMLQNFDKFERMQEVGLRAQFSINSLQLNNCNKTYSDIAFAAGVAYTDWSWAALFADFDNDGWKDLYIANGYKRDLTNNDYVRYQLDSLRKVLIANKGQHTDQWVNQIPSNKVSNYLYRNNRDFTFTNMAGKWDNTPVSFSNGAAYADLNGDGLLDMVVSNIDDTPFILRNITRSSSYLRINLKADQGKTAYGARVTLTDDLGNIQKQEFYPTRGYLSNVEFTLHFGLGKLDKVARLEIVWPDQRYEVLENVAGNQVLTLEQANAAGKYTRPNRASNIYFEDITGKCALVHRHEENRYIDFKREPLLHRKLSAEGPALAVADVNGDGLDDFFIGGAHNSPAAIYLQQPNGTFLISSRDVWQADAVHEDVAAVFFDLNQDGHPDLYVASGGNEFQDSAPEYLHRIYINDGEGNFSRAEGLMPQIRMSGACVVALDYDQDGKTDLFVGGRLNPGKYPLAPRSYLLRNTGGRLVDVTPDVAPDLLKAGMVTDACWSDLDGDRQPELTIVGEWLPVRVFAYSDGKFHEKTQSLGLEQQTGWWSSVAAADLDGDGRSEIVAGNLGRNSQLQASARKPTELFAKDFDNNGSMDAVLCYYNGDKAYPIAFRDRILDQMIFLKKKFLRYKDYADATIKDIFTDEQLKDVLYLKATTFQSTLFKENAGKYEARQLPFVAQISTVRTLLISDITGDGKPDILLAGNDYGTDAQSGRYDAAQGLFLENLGELRFKVWYPGESGFVLPGNVRRILPLNRPHGEQALLVARNNDQMQVLRIRK